MSAISLFGTPVVSAILLTLAFLGLVAEVRSPGFGRAGLAGVLALVFFFLPHWVEGAWIWWGLVAAVGVALLWPSLEDPSKRWYARGGIAITALAVYGAMLGTDVEGMDHARAVLVLVTSASLVVLVSVLLWWQLPAGLRPSSSGGIFFHVPRGVSPEVVPERDYLLGRLGQAATPLRPEGVAVFEGERVDVTTEGEWVEEGHPLEVVGTGGARVRVRSIEERRKVPRT